MIAGLLSAFSTVSLRTKTRAERIAAIQRERRMRNVCEHCEYDLTGNQSGNCPECGKVIGQVD